MAFLLPISFLRVCQKMRQCEEYKNTEAKEQKIGKNPL